MKYKKNTRFRSDVCITIGKNIKYLLAQRGITAADMARSLNTTPATVSSWVNGHRMPHPDTLISIADFLGVSVQDLHDPSFNAGTMDNSIMQVKTPIVGMGESGAQEVIGIADYVSRLGKEKLNVRAVRAEDNEMAPSILKDDTILFATPSAPIKDGSLVVISLNGHYVVRRRFVSDGMVTFTAANPAWKPLSYPQDTAPEIVGVPLYIQRKLDT